MQEIEILKWPSRSPGLKKIENLWSILADHIYVNETLFMCIKDLKSTFQEEGEKTPLMISYLLIYSMRKKHGCRSLLATKCKSMLSDLLNLCACAYLYLLILHACGRNNQFHFMSYKYDQRELGMLHEVIFHAVLQDELIKQKVSDGTQVIQYVTFLFVSEIWVRPESSTGFL